MQPVKLGGLTLKSEEKKEGVITFSREDQPPKKKDTEPEQVTEDFLNDIKNALSILIQDVGDLDKTDNTIKAIGKLKGALQLLS